MASIRRMSLGETPACVSQVLDAASGESMNTLGQGHAPAGIEEQYVLLTVVCRCTESHAGRPDAIAHGCGVNFRVDVRMDSACRIFASVACGDARHLMVGATN